MNEHGIYGLVAVINSKEEYVSFANCIQDLDASKAYLSNLMKIESYHIVDMQKEANPYEWAIKGFSAAEALDTLNICVGSIDNLVKIVCEEMEFEEMKKDLAMNIPYRVFLDIKYNQ